LADDRLLFRCHHVKQHTASARCLSTQISGNTYRSV
jgi:hypothetical protein